MKQFYLLMFFFLQLQDCINLKINSYSPLVNVTFHSNKLYSSVHKHNETFNVINKHGPSYIVYESNTELPISKSSKNIETSRDDGGKKFKKSVSNEVTAPNGDSVEDIEEEIDNFTTSNESEDANSTVLPTDVSSPENVTDFLELSTEEATEFMNTTESTLNTTLVSTTPKPVTKKSKKKKKTSHQSNSTVCECDLNKPICDVNCCCDKDCLESDKTVFTKCIDSEKSQTEYWKSKYCVSKHFAFKNNTPWLMESYSNDLFCVLKDNLPPKLKGKHPEIITSKVELNFITKQFYAWPDVIWTKTTEFDNSKPYSYNDEIWIFVNTTLQKLGVPSSSLNNYCNRRISLRYLVNSKSKCLSALPDVDMYNVYNHSDHLYLISSPLAVNETWIKSPKECPANVCIPIIPYVCNLQNCSLLNSTENRPQPSCGENGCIDMITSVKYYFYTNGSEGYTNASIYFGLSDMFLTSKYIEQDFEITQSFINRNASENVRSLSGNPGYTFGKPIIISKMIAYKEKNASEEIDILEYLSSKSPYPLQNVFAIPKNINGLCILSNLSFQEIRFHDNVQFKCQTVQNISDFILKGNATDACVSHQFQLMNYMQYNFIEGIPKIFVSTIGNPTQDGRNWIEILHEFTSNPITGVFGEDKETLSCFNMMSKVHYTFVYVAAPQANAPNQLNILGVGAKYSAHDNNVFEVKDNLIVGTLSVSTRFVDVTKPQDVRFARGPSFHIHLPADFFYPFAFNNSPLITVDRISSLISLIMLLNYTVSVD